ncbi:hypothetical protein Lfu02_40550 [Longispora fulva]|uniref:Alpha-L-arabinofuranosidase B arabinose-binding domain-containing protein n=1 Tax=Longispora fulva TaxID=619741 RepID=A0A8J7GPF4_9ACTN|nr:AbfB domain-containing protein [Longispora fulva]MBG6136514.1 hypothetical protein [Longispora fulva]GIG59683.1 hypothetical protein Lfu02_40550 [Longispora fulva]
MDAGVSIRVTTPGYIAHVDYWSGTLLKNDASFKLRPGLAGTCYSFEPVNYPGYYLRHRDGEVWIDPYQGTSLFAYDASWWLETPAWVDR